MSESYLTEEEAPKLSTTLNVLTILTFVMCAYELYTAVRNFTSGAESLQKLQDAQSKMENAPAFMKKLAGPEMIELLQKSIANRVPLLIISLVAIALCVFGAIEMRKLKKQGYWLWLFGELLPIVGGAIIMGGLFFNIFFAIFIIFPLIFIILYTVQRKNLVY